MSKEDLVSKLMQRAEFVAQREEMDECGKGLLKQFGQEFQLYFENKRENYNKLIEVNFYKGMLRHLKNLALDDSVTSKIDCLLDGTQGLNTNLMDLRRTVFLFADQLNFTLNEELLVSKLFALKRDREKANKEKAAQMKDVEKEAQILDEKVQKNIRFVDQMLIPDMKVASKDFKNSKKIYNEARETVEKVQKVEFEVQMEIGMLGEQLSTE